MSEESARVCELCEKQGSTSNALSRCSRCRAVYYCSQSCQTAHWPAHKKTCDALVNLHAQQVQSPSEVTLDFIPAVELLGGQGSPFNPREITLPKLLSEKLIDRGVVSPISRLIGVPLVISRHMAEDPLAIPRQASLDNQAVTYLMIDPESGYASPSWQQCIGPVTVIREDRKPLSSLALEMIWMYLDLIVEHFGDEGEAPRWRYAPKAFQEWCRRYKQNNPSYSGVKLPL